MELKRLVGGSKSERSDNLTTLKVNVQRTCIQHIHPNRRDYLATLYFQFCNLDVVDVSDVDVSSTVPAVYLLFVLSKVTIMDRQQSNRNLHLTRFSNHIRVTRKFELSKFSEHQVINLKIILKDNSPDSESLELLHRLVQVLPCL